MGPFIAAAELGLPASFAEYPGLRLKVGGGPSWAAPRSATDARKINPAPENIRETDFVMVLTRVIPFSYR